MNRLLFFNYCAIPIFLIILITTFLRKTTKRLPNKMFIVIISVSLFTTLVDFVADGFDQWLPLSPGQLALVTAANYAYFATRNAIAVLYLQFLFSLTRTDNRFRFLRPLIAVPYLSVILVLATNPGHQMAFRITAEAGYIRGPLIAVFYTASILYSVAGCLHLFYCIKILRPDKWIALMSMYILSFAGILIQLFFPHLLVEIFVTAVAFLLVVLVVLRPEEITDTNVGLPSWKAYCDELHKIVTLRLPVQINVLHYINASQVREYLGETRFNNYIKQIADAIENHRRHHKIPMDLYYEAPGWLYFVVNDRNTRFDYASSFENVSAEMRYATREIEQLGVYLLPRMCMISYPDDLSSEQEIIQLGHSFHEMLAENQLVIKAADLVGTHRYEIEANIGDILRRAITENRFEMYYQPIYRVKDGTFPAAEALIRLNDRYYGSISPAVFIPDAEKNGLIMSVGDFVLESVFCFISEHDLRALGLDYIEINLSVAQCFQPDLSRKIRALQSKYHVAPANVNFEITETTYGNISDIAQRNILELVEDGYSFSLDDYGTGYSNMQRIVRLPLSLIKLDKSLIDEIHTTSGASVVRNTIKMMQDISKHVLAEGVETKEQLDLLTEMNCDYIQGFYFSKPLASSAFVQFITEHR